MHAMNAIVLIVLIITLARFFSGRSRVRRSVRLEQGRFPERDELEAEVIELRKRIAVLERIATDDRKSRALAEEIESLRE